VFIGGIGFVVNYLLLLVLFDWLGMPILFSQLIGAELALLSTFVGNNFWSFTHHHHISLKRKFITYHGTAGAGILITSSTIILLVQFAELYYGLALVIAASIGMVWNYIWNKKVVFKRHRSER